MKTIKQRLAALLIAMAAITGLGLVTAAPAQALSLSQPQYCPWPGRAMVTVSNLNVYADITVYSKTGWVLGSKRMYNGQTWKTGWADVLFWGKSNDSSWTMRTNCYL